MTGPAIDPAPVIECRMRGTRVISCDVFDTLLLRNGRAEPRRVGLIARHGARALAEQCGMTIAPAVLAEARRTVQAQAYRGLDMLDPGGEVKFAAMMDALAMVLGLAPPAAQVLARAEIAVETTELRANRRLIAWLHERARAGLRIIAISDTWHEGATIRGLLDTLAPGHPVAAVYTSADLDATKRSARIFALVAAREGVAAADFLHIGDDRLADEAMARRAGLQVRPLRPARLTLLRRRLDGALFRVMRPLPPA